MLSWGDRFNICCFLDNHQYKINPHRFECILAAGALDSFSAPAGKALDGLKDFSLKNPGWLFGHFSYDLKNELERLESAHEDHLHFDDLFFFVPETIIILEQNTISIHSAGDKSAEVIFRELMEQPTHSTAHASSFNIQSRFNRNEYIQVIEKLKQHILAGDCYEINFCQEFFQEQVNLKPLETYFRLTKISPNPFGAFYKLFENYLLCASPERYLWKQDLQIVSQPIKGTSKREPDAGKDEQTKHELKISTKNRSENVMVVDLVRNDLSRIAKEGTVKVEELYGVYSFPQVHQMISTISGVADPEHHWTNYIRATFPMGSMTGAPKKRVMELIERYEKSRRGLFSGALGYVTPEGNFDFNVVIRSILYNSHAKYLSYQVGSAITFYSDPEQEYEECLLKAEAIKKVLT